MVFTGLTQTKHTFKPPVKETRHEYVEVGGCHYTPEITDDGEAKAFDSNALK